jgi:RimJ/RimL family protein N-acetyltransferase
MAGLRAVPNLTSPSIEVASAFYASVLGFRVAMDQGWIVTLVDPDRPHVQLSLLTHDATAPTVAAGAEIVHPLTDEPWGVRRFFLRDPDGNVVNVLAHRPDPGAATSDEPAADAIPAAAPGSPAAGAPSAAAPAPPPRDFAGPVTLERDGVRLVPLSVDHAPGLAAAAADGELWRIPVTSVPAPGDEQGYVERAWAMPDRTPFAVLDADGTVVGSTSYHDILPAPRRVSIGYTWYATRYQRSALNTTCKLLLLRHAFETLGCRTVGWTTDGENFRSQRAIERLGARKDGTIRGNGMRRDGTPRDSVMYSLTADEWPAARDRLERRRANGGHDGAAHLPG